MITDLNESSWVLEESSIPASILDAPRPHEDPPADYDYPDADETMGCSGPNPKGFAIAQNRDDLSREAAWQSHSLVETSSRLTGPWLGRAP